jgi:hypothetical protein
MPTMGAMALAEHRLCRIPPFTRERDPRARRTTGGPLPKVIRPHRLPAMRRDEATQEALEIVDWAQVAHTAECEESPPADLTDVALLLARLIRDIESLLPKIAAMQADLGGLVLRLPRSSEGSESRPFDHA